MAQSCFSCFSFFTARSCVTLAHLGALGLVQGHHNYARMLEKGLGVAMDKKKALELFQKAADWPAARAEAERLKAELEANTATSME